MTNASLYENFYHFASDNPELDTVQKSYFWMKVVFDKIRAKREAKMREAILALAREKKRKEVPSNA